jgi:hypothetical protein
MNFVAKFAAQVRQQLQRQFGPAHIVAKFVAQIRQQTRSASSPPIRTTTRTHSLFLSKILNNSAKRPAQAQNAYTLNSATNATLLANPHRESRDVTN